MRVCAILICAAASTEAAAFQLDWPVDCTLGQTCYIQNYVDRDPGPAATDFTCGPLTYDGHKGTDIRVPTLRDLGRTAPEVFAAAPGTVTGIRDAMADQQLTDDPATRAAVQGQECGNGVVIDHGQGWVSQYCHMARDSISVEPGETVAAGDTLGRMGLSGATEFPHLHFSLRHDGNTVDPFAPDADHCGETSAQLWADPIAYAPGGLLTTGHADQVPDYTAIQRGVPRSDTAATDQPLILWAFGYGARAEDAIRFTLSGTQGMLFDRTVVLEKTQAQLFRAFGRRAPPEGWPEGTYRARIALRRDGEVLSEDSFALTLARPD